MKDFDNFSPFRDVMLSYVAYEGSYSDNSSIQDCKGHVAKRMAKLTSGQNKTGSLRNRNMLIKKNKTNEAVTCLANGKVIIRSESLQYKQILIEPNVLNCSTAFRRRETFGSKFYQNFDRCPTNAVYDRLLCSIFFLKSFRTTMKFEAAIVVSCAQTRTGHLHNMEKPKYGRRRFL
uniref:Uncharacterized protein n=1 Tax=Glossina palpalis gambiensis TaxID=67801 RepID=A0A1B0BXC8_9MUSC